MNIELDNIISGFQRMSEMAQIRDLRREARATIAPRCGNCEHWMKTRVCPREEFSKPTCGDPPCSKHQEQESTRALYNKRVAEIERREKLLAVPHETAP